MTRTQVRSGIPTAGRLTLLEDDADHFERRLEREVKAIRRAQKYTNGIGIAILLSLIGALAAVAFK